MAIDRKTVKNIAFLARIEVPEADMDKLAGELSGIVGWIEQLSEVNVEGVEPMYSVSQMTLPQRKDEITDGGYQEKVLRNAPDADEGYFLVPKVVE